MRAPLVLALLAGCDPGAFVCEASSECDGGVCTLSGACAHPSTDCASGFASGAGACVTDAVELAVGHWPLLDGAGDRTRLQRDLALLSDTNPSTPWVQPAPAFDRARGLYIDNSQCPPDIEAPRCHLASAPAWDAAAFPASGTLALVVSLEPPRTGPYIEQRIFDFNDARRAQLWLAMLDVDGEAPYEWQVVIGARFLGTEVVGVLPTSELDLSTGTHALAITWGALELALHVDGRRVWSATPPARWTPKDQAFRLLFPATGYVRDVSLYDVVLPAPAIEQLAR